MKIYKSGAEPIPDGTVYVGRGTMWGNPYHIGRHGTREQVIGLYRSWVMGSPDLLRDIRDQLRGKSLVCHCTPLPCHAEVLMEIANAP